MKKVLFLGFVLLAAATLVFGNYTAPKRVAAEIVNCEDGQCEVIETVPTETIKDDAGDVLCEDNVCVPHTEDLPVVTEDLAVVTEEVPVVTEEITTVKNEIRGVNELGAKSKLHVNGMGNVKITPDSAVNFSAAYNDALIKAVETAQEKAEKLGTAMGVGEMKLVALKEISNNYWTTYERAHFFHGDIDVSATVELVYKIN